MRVDQEKVISYLLDELTPSELDRFEAELAENPEMLAAVAEMRPVVAKVGAIPAEVWKPVEPPALDLARATAAGPQAPLSEREDEADSSGRRNVPVRSTWFRAAGVLAAAAMLLVVGYLIGSGSRDDGEYLPGSGVGPTIALDRFGEAPSAAEGEVRMVSESGDQMRLKVAGLKPNSGGEFYELWLLGDDGQMIALGSFQIGEGGERSVELPLPTDPSSFEYFDVSVQSDDEGPEHSGRSVLRGRTTGELQ